MQIKRVAIRYRRGLDEQVAERRMRHVGVGRGEHDLRVAGNVEAPHLAAVIGQGDASQFRIVLGRDDHFGADLDVVVDPPPDRAIRRKRHFVFRRLERRRLVSGRPDATGVEVADVEEAAPGVGRDDLRASASAPDPAGGCSRRRRWSASPSRSCSTADACAD